MEGYEYQEQCFDCGAPVGELHERGCHHEPCPYCGCLFSHCDCSFFLDDMGEELPDEDRIAWDGHFPCVRGCIRLNYALKGTGGHGLVRCNVDDPDAEMLDIHQLIRECEWDHTQKRWVLATQPMTLEEKKLRAFSIVEDRVRARRAAKGASIDAGYDSDDGDDDDEQ